MFFAGVGWFRSIRHRQTQKLLEWFEKSAGEVYPWLAGTLGAAVALSRGQSHQSHQIKPELVQPLLESRATSRYTVPMNYANRITFDPEQCGGRLCIRHY